MIFFHRGTQLSYFLAVQAHSLLQYTKGALITLACECAYHWGFSDALTFYSAGSWVSALSGSAAFYLRSSECGVRCTALQT